MTFPFSFFFELYPRVLADFFVVVFFSCSRDIQTTFHPNELSAVGKYATAHSPSPWVTPQYIYETYGIPQVHLVTLNYEFLSYRLKNSDFFFFKVSYFLPRCFPTHSFRDTGLLTLRTLNPLSLSKSNTFPSPISNLSSTTWDFLVKLQSLLDKTTHRTLVVVRWTIFFFFSVGFFSPKPLIFPCGLVSLLFFLG